MRQYDHHPTTMRAVAGGLEDSDIQALAGYLGSLGP